MNGLLRTAQKDLNKLRKVTENNEEYTLIITVDFGKNDDVPKPASYPAYLDALKALGGDRTIDDIIEACKISGINERSVLFDEKDYEPIVIKVPITKELACRFR